MPDRNESPESRHDPQPEWAIRMEMKVDTLRDDVAKTNAQILIHRTDMEGPPGYPHLGLKVRVDRLQQVTKLLLWISGIAVTGTIGSTILILIKFAASGALLK